MTDIQRIRALEIEQDLSFQRRMWTVQRVGWVVMALLLLAALAGLFGPGPLSSATASEGGLEVEYQRFTRYLAPGTLRFRIPAETTAEGRVELWLDHDALDAVQIQSIVPEPDSVDGDDDRAIYTFTVEEPGRPMFVTLRLTHEAMGARTVSAGIVGGPQVDFWQLTYP